MIIKKDQDTIQSYFEDESGLLGGHAELVAVPHDEKEVSEFLRECSGKKMPVTISGAGTGVTGGRVPFGGAVLSTERLNRVVSLGNSRITVQPAVNVKDLKEAALGEGLMYPPDPTEQTSWIGGNVATNASGSRGLKYGSTRKYITRLRAVFSTGEILDIPRGKYTASAGGVITVPFKQPLRIALPSYKLPFIKNAAGYFNYPGADLIDLIIGSEGTLCAVTEIEASLLPATSKTLGGVAFFEKKEGAWEFAASAGRERTPLSLEYFDSYALELLRPDYPNIPAKAAAAIFFEQETTEAYEDNTIGEWEKLIERHGVNVDSVWFSTAPRDQESFREFRHRLPEKVNEIVRANKFPKVGTDIAVPAAGFPEMLRCFTDTLEALRIRHLIFGHIGECHLHANMLPVNEDQYKESRAAYLWFVEKAVGLGGTVSAEHGIGKLKHAFLEKMLGKKALKEMSKLKKTLDPAGILGQGNIFPKELL